MGTDEQPRAPRSTLAIAGAIAGIVVGVYLLYVFRHEASPVPDRLYNWGNVLATHELSEITWRGLNADLGRVELTILAALVAFVASKCRRSSPAPLVVASATFAAIFGDSIARGSAVIANRLYFYMADDAFISMRYARNFAEGRGLVYNAGEYVDGFSNPLWTFIMVLPHEVGLHEGVTALPILILSGLLLVGAGVFAYLVLDDERIPSVLRILAVMAIFFEGSAFEFALTGLETPLLAFASPLFVYGAHKKRESLMAIALVVLALVRADGAVVGAVLAAWLVREEMVTGGLSLKDAVLRHKRAFGAFGIAALGLILWRLALYGHPAPNTAYLKVFALSVRIKNGLAGYGVRGIYMYGLPAAFVLLAPRGDELAQRARRLLAPVVVVWLYAIYVGGDAFLFLRFVAPVTPLLWIGVALAASSFWERLGSETKALAFGALALIVPAKSERGVLGSSWEHQGWMDDCVVAAKSIDRNVPPGKTVGTFYAGFAYFAPTRTFVDLLGKTDAHIAHEETTHGTIPGHNKYDFAYSYAERKPDVTYTALFCHEVERFLALPPAEQQRVKNNFLDFQYRAPIDQMMDPAFRTLYAPHRVKLMDGAIERKNQPLGCWFVREGADVPTEWRLARE